MHDAKVALGVEKKHWVDQECEAMCPKLSMKQRVIGYCCCFGLGSLLNMFSWGSLTKLVQGEPANFVVLFVLGNVIQLMGSMFISGPVAYGKKLVGKTMRLAAFLYFSSMISLLIVCFIDTIKSNKTRLGLVCLLIVVIYVCMGYFFICSIPFGKRMVDGCIASLCKEKCDGCRKSFGLKQQEESTTTKILKTTGVSGGGSSSAKKGGLLSLSRASEPAPEPAKKGFFGV